MSEMHLAERAALFNRIVLEQAMDQHGLIRHALTYPDRRPITEDMLDAVRRDKERRQRKGLKWHPLAGTPAYAMYEDANYVGNRYLISQVWRWRATQSPEARAAAGKAYAASMYPYDEGARLERGYWPKPYGALKGENAVDRNYTETSVDQAYSPVIALWRYYQYLADEPAKKRIAEALQAHGHWWINHNYQYDYLGEKWQAIGQVLNPSSLKIPIGMHIAYRMTGDTVLRDECHRLVRKGFQDGAIRMHRGPRGEIKELYHWAEIYDYFMRETELKDATDWERLIRECWRAGQSTIQEDGLCVRMGTFTEAGLVEKYEPGPIDDVHHGYWKTDARDPGSTVMIANLAMLVQELGYDPNATAVGSQLLAAVTEERTDGLIYLRPEQMAPENRENPPSGFFSTRVVVFWLDAYWRGKLLGVF
jgi:hypothetical protein